MRAFLRLIVHFRGAREQFVDSQIGVLDASRRLQMILELNALRSVARQRYTIEWQKSGHILTQQCQGRKMQENQ
ncbi:hypothetical protein EMIT0158MI4_30305 [Burkholderia ambifaria]